VTENIFKSFDGTGIEAELYRAGHQRGCVVFWPCMGGAFGMYRFPAGDFTERGYSVVLYNPRGHGASGGQMSIQTALKDLDFFIAGSGLKNVPLVGIGHSAGANALLQYSSFNANLDRFFLVAPVLDSRMSLEYLYDRGNIGEFNDILAMRAGARDVIDECLGDSRWMDRAYWDEMGLRRYMDAKSGPLMVGTFLENLFLPGHNAYGYLREKARVTDVIVAAEDHWYPLEETKRLAADYGFSLTEIKQARDHFFTRAWKHVWALILGELSGPR